MLIMIIIIIIIIMIIIIISSSSSSNTSSKVILGIRLLGATFWRGSSDHQAATAQMHSVNKNHRRVPTHLRITSPIITNITFIIIRLLS